MKKPLDYIASLDYSCKHDIFCYAKNRIKPENGKL